jgi:hypothetical protein
VLTVVIVYAAVVVSTAIWTASAWALNLAVGARVTEVAFGPLPIAITRTVRGVKIKLSPWPSSSLALLGRAPDDRDDSPRSWRRLGLGRRLVAVLAPWLPVLAIAVVTLGPARAVASSIHAVHQLLFVLDPTPLARGFVRLAAAAPFAITVGVVCAKLGAFNLLPVPPLAGGGAISEVARTLRPDRGATPLGRAWMIAGMLVMLFVVARLGYAFARVALG